MVAAKVKSKVLDFTNTKERSAYNPKHVEAGDYRAKIVSVDDGDSKAGNEMWTYGIQLADMVSAVYPYYCILDENNLWKIRNLLQATGITVPKKRFNVDPNKVVGKLIGITLDDDEYDGKPKSVISAVFSIKELDGDTSSSDDDDDIEDDVEEEEEPTPPKQRAPRRKAPEPEPEEDDDEEEEEPEPPKRRSSSASKRSSTRSRRASEPEDDDDDEEPEPPKRRRSTATATRASSAHKKPAARAKAAPPDDDDLEDEDFEELDADDL